MFTYVGGNGSPLDREQNGTMRDLTLVPRDIALNGGQGERQNLVKRSSEGGRWKPRKKVIGEMEYSVSEYCQNLFMVYCGSAVG